MLLLLTNLRGLLAADALSVNEAVKLSRTYLQSEDDEARQDIKAQLAAFDGEISRVLDALAKRSHRQVKPGYHGDEKFRSPELLEKYPHDWLYFVVPKTYTPEKPTGLIVFLHGGGLYTSRDAAKYTLRTSQESEDGSGDMLAATGMITVGPSAPGKGESYYRWCLKASEEYIADVIEECKSRYNIDPDRVFLLGHSMGGFGAFHHAQRQPDRFAAIIASSGAWDCGYWPALRGTPFCMVQGVNDAVRGQRWHHTDVEYARHTARIFEREKLEHVYYEHEGYHGFSENRDDVARYFAASERLRRDPYSPRIAIGTPQGFNENYLHPVQHNRWLSLDERTSGKIRIDELVATGDDFDEWKLVHRRPMRSGACIEAVNRGENRIEVTSENVARFTIWLHPQMVDPRKPVTIAVDDGPTIRAHLRPSLVTALESYERRRDWGLIYPMKVEVALAE
jgi:pimeloyl-ACP methyl ester carboxylesterase